MTIQQIISSMNLGPLQRTCDQMLVGPTDDFSLWPASLSHHHAEAGGLLRHTVEVCMIADAVLKSGAVRPMRRDSVIAACLWHDYTKTREYVLVSRKEVLDGRRFIPAIGGLVWTKSPEVADGDHPHIQWSADAFVKAAVGCGLAENVIREVESLILSHHGRVEWGSPFEPQTQAAWLVHQADMISASMGASV